MAKNETLTMQEMWGEGFSTYWRKGSDTKLSSVIFNIIHALPDDDVIWPAFNTFVFEQIGEITCVNITAAQIKKAVLGWDTDQATKLGLRGSARHLAIAFSSSMCLIDDNEFSNLAEWFHFCAGV